MLSSEELEQLDAELQSIGDRDSVDDENSSEYSRKWTIDEYQGLIEQLGNYFFHTEPHTADDTYIIKTAYILHKLKENFDETYYDISLRDNLIKPLSTASALARDIDINARRGDEFYEDVVALGDKLLNFHSAIVLATPPAKE